MSISKILNNIKTFPYTILTRTHKNDSIHEGNCTPCLTLGEAIFRAISRRNRKHPTAVCKRDEFPLKW